MRKMTNNPCPNCGELLYTNRFGYLNCSGDCSDSFGTEDLQVEAEHDDFMAAIMEEGEPDWDHEADPCLPCYQNDERDAEAEADFLDPEDQPRITPAQAVALPRGEQLSLC